VRNQSEILYPSKYTEITLEEALNNTKIGHINLQTFSNCSESLKLFLCIIVLNNKKDRIFDNPQTKNAFIQIPITQISSYKDFSEQLTNLYKSLSFKNLNKSNIINQINMLIRVFTNLLLAKTDKETCYSAYWILLTMLNYFEQCENIKTDVDLVKKREFVENLEKTIRQEFESKIPEIIEETAQKYSNEINELRQKLTENQEKLNQAEKDLVQFKNAQSEMISKVETNVIMENLGHSYGKVREALNNTYDNQLAYFLIRLYQ